MVQFIMGSEPLLAADDAHDPEGATECNTHGASGDDGEATDGGSPSGLSAIPEETESDFSAHVHQLVLAVWQEIRDTDSLNEELGQTEPAAHKELLDKVREQCRLVDLQHEARQKAPQPVEVLREWSTILQCPPSYHT